MKNHQRFFAWLMTVIMLFGMVTTAQAAGCTMTDTGRHDLSWRRPNGDAPDCRTEVVVEQYCTKCGEVTWSDTEQGPCVPGDQWVWDSTPPANCMEAAIRNQLCKYCGMPTNEREESGPHSWRETIVEEPWCDVGGMKAVICSVCGEWQNNGTPLNPLGHDWGSWVADGGVSCTSGGTETRTCSRCGATESRNVQAKGHDWGDWYRRGVPTCTEEGVSGRNCNRCGLPETMPIPALGHNFGEWYVVTEAAIGVPGLEQRDCLNGCGTFEQREIPALEGNGKAPVALPGLSLSLTLDSTPANGQYFVVGEQVIFTAAWVNDSSETLFPFYASIWPYEQPSRTSKDLPYSCSWDAEEPIVPGMTGSHSMVITVTEEDVARGGIYAMAYIWASVHNGPELEEVSTPFVTAPCGEGSLSADGLELTLVLSSTPANGTHFVVGEEVSFTETWSNGTDKTLYPFSVSIWTCDVPSYGSMVDQICSWFAEDGGGPVAPGASGSHTLTVTVTEADVDRGAIYAVAELLSTVHNGPDLENVTTPFVTAPCGASEVDLDGLTVTKSAPDGSHNKYYYPGEQVPFTITVTNNTGVELRDVEITDPLKGGNEDAVVDRIVSMQPDESVAVTFNYTTTEADAAIGTECFENTAYATGYTADGTQVNGTSNTVKVQCVVPHELTISKTVSGTPANGEFYVPGETICFIISLTNDTPYPLYNVVLTDPLCEDQYFHDEVNGMSYLYMDNFDSGDDPQGYSSAQVAPTYVVTEADAEAGFVTNTAIVNYQTWNGENKTASASVTVKCGKASDAVVLEKIDMRSPANGEYYVPGEVIKYGLTVRSTEDNPLQNIIIYDPLKGGNQVVFGPADSWVLGAGFDYTVTEADAQRGYIENTGYATFTYQNTGEDGTVYSNTLTLPCGFVKDAGLSSALSLTKSVTSTPANGSYYVPGETVTYEVCVVNNGDPLNNLHVSDWMWEQSRAFGTINTNEDVTYPVSYTITELDATSGCVSNIAFAEAVAANGDPVMEYSNDVTVPCGFPEGSDLPFGTFADLAIIKQEESLPLNGSYYTLGEEIHYRITYTNAGELTMLDVEIFDLLDGVQAIASAEKLEPGESRTCNYIHVVTDADVAAGYVCNTATGTYMASDYAGSATSNSVVSDTSAAENFWGEPLPDWGTVDPDYVIPAWPPAPGFPTLPSWTPDGGFVSIPKVPIGEVVLPEYPLYPFGTSDGTATDPSGTTTPPSMFGTIDTEALHAGTTSCMFTITGRDQVSASYEISFCPEHADTQSSVLMMSQMGATPEMQMQAAAYAVALWRTEVESLYQTLMNAADPTAKAILMTEYVRFLADLANYELMLKALYPDQPALVAQKVADMWQDKCATLCYEMHTTAAERTDSLLNVEAAAGGSADACACVTSAEENGKRLYTQTYCPTHGFPFAMIDMLLKGEDTAEAWTMVRQIWSVELTSAYNKISARLGESSGIATAEHAALMQWMIAREASLIALYPNNPEVVAQAMVKTIMDRVNDLCLTGK